MSGTTAKEFNAFAGLLHAGSGGTFMRLPHVAADAQTITENGINVAFLGFPWDAMCISRTGANYGPRALREASDQFSFYNANLNLDLREHYKFADCGDVPVVPGAAIRTMDRAEAMILDVLKGGAMPVVLGGDHSVTIACARAFRKHHDNPGLILVDSHFDTAIDVGGEELNHACPIARAIDAGFDPRKIVIIGTNGWLNPKAELEYAREQGISLMPLETIMEKGPIAVGREARAIAGAGTDSVYLTFDIDAIDGAYAPGTGVPAPGGLTSREAIALVSELGRGGLGGLDVVEVSPPYDHDGITSRLAVRLVLETLAATTTR
ncbi:agmatinase [Microbaculum marinisediminis]|uniref:Agmatinase n=1 Tax=Microbaculum marinisediminis TaxID=2931392 RepID=A0AAW5R546_9HYPH|nr:agmatinase [Microbaculum sp. A6E488]MCT8974247.1 agmatinase [Microbaculum sp. A6E488]